MLPNTFTELVNLLLKGATIEVECRKKVEDLEDYADAGMRLTIAGARESYDGVVILGVSYEKYDEFNKAFEKCNYFDKEGQPRLNAREAGYYKAKDTMYVMSTDDPNEYFLSLEDSANKWIQEYFVRRHKDETYVAFLERTLSEASKHMRV
jgi:hypothetical protein